MAPMEPERKIEKWLRAYAKKRRGQADASLKMHPATRRLLQDEVARQRPAEEDNDSVSLWELIRRQWAFLLSFAVCIFLVGVVLLPVLKFGKKPTSLGSSVSQVPEMGQRETPPPPALPPQPPAPIMAVTAEPMTKAPVAQPPAPVTAGGNYTLTFGTSAALPAGSFPGTNQVLVAASDEERLELPATSPGVERRLVGESQNVFKNGILAQSTPVLANFQVQQNGNAIRVVDQDGSVYSGWLALGSQHAATRNAATIAAQNAVNAATGLPSVPLGQMQNAVQAARGYFFRVYGLNRTLNQNVMFTGTLVANSMTSTNMWEDKDVNITMDDSIAVGGESGGGGAGGVGADGALFRSEATNQLAPLPWPSLRITGTAVINNTNLIQVNAAPVSPKNN